jgi:hypothetical protein
MLMMGWNSKASSQQRAGRAGRVSRGTVIRLYTEKFRASMREFDDPEILRTPLERTVLRAKLMMPAAFGSVSHLLAQTLSPPGITFDHFSSFFPTYHPHPSASTLTPVISPQTCEIAPSTLSILSLSTHTHSLSLSLSDLPLYPSIFLPLSPRTFS